MQQILLHVSGKRNRISNIVKRNISGCIAQEIVFFEIQFLIIINMIFSRNMGEVYFLNS